MSTDKTSPLYVLPGKNGEELLKLPNPQLGPHAKLGDLLVDFDKLAVALENNQDALNILAKVYATTHQLIIRNDKVEQMSRLTESQLREKLAEMFRKSLIDKAS